MLRATLILSTLLLAAFIGTVPSDLQGSQGSPAPIGQSMWKKYIICYGPNFPLAPMYAKTETDTFNVTLDGQNMGGVSLKCGPVPYGLNATNFGRFNVAKNSTDLHWNETITIANMTKATEPLDYLFQNLTETIYVDGAIFANFTIILMPGQYMAVLACNPAAHPWNFMLNATATFTYPGPPFSFPPPPNTLYCSNTHPQDALGPMPIPPGFYDFHLTKLLNATYNAASQPSDLRTVTDLNGSPLDRSYIWYYPGSVQPSECANVGGVPDEPGPDFDELGMELSQNPLYVVQGGATNYPRYLILFPNDPTTITGHGFRVEVIDGAPPVIPSAVTFKFTGFTPLVTSPFGTGLPTTTASLPGLFVDLQLSSAATTPTGTYNFKLNITDLTTSQSHVWSTAQLMVCPAPATTPVTPMQVLLSLFGIMLLLVTGKKALQKKQPYT